MSNQTTNDLLRSGYQDTEHPGSPRSGIVRRFRYKSGADTKDFLTCRTWDGTTEGSHDILIAKPWLIRKEPHNTDGRDGFTFVYATHIQRTATKAGEDEVQDIEDAYIVNDNIWAILTAREYGGTGVVDDKDPADRYV